MKFSHADEDMFYAQTAIRDIIVGNTTTPELESLVEVGCAKDDELRFMFNGMKKTMTSLIKNYGEKTESMEAGNLGLDQYKIEKAIKSNALLTSLFSNEYFKDNSNFQLQLSNFNFRNMAIAGGYVRNKLLGIEDFNTDFDVVINDDYTMLKFFRIFFHKVRNAAHSEEYTFDQNALFFLRPGITEEWKNFIMNNKIHVIDAYNRTLYEASETLHNKRNQRIKFLDHEYVAIEPTNFDFTINLSTIDVQRGKIYAPPITLYDLEKKILRQSTYALDNDRIPMTESIVIRAVRFAIKYGFSMEKELYYSIKGLVNCINHFNSPNIKTIIRSLEHLLAEPESLQTDIMDGLKQLDFWHAKDFNNIPDYIEWLKKIPARDENYSSISGLDKFSRPHASY